jgi:hypothetical protein
MSRVRSGVLRVNGFAVVASAALAMVISAAAQATTTFQAGVTGDGSTAVADGMASDVSALTRGGASGTGSPVLNVVTVAREPAQQMMYGMDFERLWSWDTLKPEGKKRLAEVSVKECRVQYVRVAVRSLAEPEEGVFKPEAYDEILEMMSHLKAARPDVKFFGSPRPISGEDGGSRRGLPYTCYPLWITAFAKETHHKTGQAKWKFTGFDPVKAADYMVRYVRFMKTKGFAISYLDLKNEIDRLIEADQGKVMAERLRRELGAECPLLVAPSSFEYAGAADWMNACQRGPGIGFFDIASTHNTGSKGSLEGFVAQAREAGKPVWNTELHSWRGPDEAAATNTAKLFYQIRSGVGGINDWLSLGNQKKDFKMFRAMDDGSLEVMRIYFIYKQLVNTSGGGNYVPTTIPAGLSSTAAFARGKLMTVWLLNGHDAPVKRVKVELGGRSVAGASLRTVRWGPDTPREGLSAPLSLPAKSSTVDCDVSPMTLLCLEFETE